MLRIQPDTEPISGRRVILHGICFYLDRATIDEILKAKASRTKLDFTPVLPNAIPTGVQLDWRNFLESGLKFSSYYQQGDTAEVFIQSLIAFDGEIRHQVSTTCLNDPQFAFKLISAHHWAVEQLLKDFGKKEAREVPRRLGWRWQGLAWAMSLLLTGLIVLMLWDWLIPLNLLKIFLIILLGLLVIVLQLGIQKLWHWLIFRRS